MIPEAAVEAAARAYYPQFWSSRPPVERWDAEHEHIKKKVRAIVRPLLEAAAPHMKFDAHTAKPDNWV